LWDVLGLGGKLLSALWDELWLYGIELLGLSWVKLLELRTKLLALRTELTLEPWTELRSTGTGLLVNLLEIPVIVGRDSAKLGTALETWTSLLLEDMLGS
jgi:hypothetical protein